MANPLSGFWARLTPRERTYILALVLTFFVMGTALLFYMRGGSLREIEQDIDTYRVALQKVQTRGAVYEERLKAKEQRESKIATDPISFATLLEEAQGGLEGVTPSNQDEPPPLPLGDGLVKRTYEFQLKSVTLENVTKFLVSIESKPKRVILTEELQIRSNSSSEDRLNVDVKLATWERQAAAAGSDEEEDEEGGS